MKQETNQEYLLEIKDLTTAFLFDGKPVPVTVNVSYGIRKARFLALWANLVLARALR